MFSLKLLRIYMSPKKKAFWLSFFLIFSSTAAWANSSISTNSDYFPKPYIYKDNGIGNIEPKFSLNKSGVLPNWLSLAAQQRTRYETLNSQFRSATTGSDQILSLRTLAQATLRLHPRFKIQLELQDSRAELADGGTRLNTAIVNATELLEANVQWLEKGLFQDQSYSVMRGGRLTMDIGTRRLVARNRFRNTKNAFTGFDWIWKSKDGSAFRALFTLPINRQPTATADLLKNKTSLDKESFDQIFWGVFYNTTSLLWDGKGEFYLFGIHESDGQNFATRNRKLYTPGLRFYRPNKKGRFDYEWESIFQFGKTRASANSIDMRDLDHFAHFHHVEAGYSFSMAWSPRLILAYDYASGDSDPNDGKNGRFDTLFGAAVFDYGPTSIHRAFIRSNISGPGIKLLVKPHKQVSAYLHYRTFWLASDTDIWAGNSNLRDATGNSNSFLGHQLFLRGKWQALANVQFEAGLAYRIDGDFQDTAPNSPGEGNTLYSYAQATLSF